jgi:hypothetical protein
MGTLKTTNIQTITGSGTLTLGTSGETLTVPTGVTLDTTSATQNRPAFQAGISSSVGIGSSAQTLIPLDVARYDIGSNYNTSTYRFTAPKAGRYLFAATIRFDSAAAGSYMRCYFAVNGNTGYSGANYTFGHVISGGNHSTDYESLAPTAVLNLAANDYVQVYGGRNGGSSTIQTESQFSGYFLG